MPHDLDLGVVHLGLGVAGKKVVFRGSGYGFYIPRETNNGGFHSMFDYVSRVLSAGGVFKSAKGGDIRDAAVIKRYILDAVEEFLNVYGDECMGIADKNDWLIFVKNTKDFNGDFMTATYIEACANVRYWEDSSVNGVSDDTGTLIPFRNGENWHPIIELEHGKIVDWPTGMKAAINYKVCDGGKYWLLDENKKRIAKWSSYYVPNDFLCHGDNGYGDYILFDVDENGFIVGYKKPEIKITTNSIGLVGIAWLAL